MTINDILKLDIQKKNFRKIESFINHATKDSFDYYKAVSYKALMFYKLSDVKEAITLLLTNLNETKNDDAIVSYSDSLIKIYLDLSDFEKANRYIELKDSHLSPIDKQEHTKDLIMYYAKRRDSLHARENINLYLNDDITLEDRIFVMRLLLDYAYEDNKLSEFNDNYEEVIKYYLDNDLKEDYQKLYLYKLNILFNNKKYEEDLTFIRSIDIEALDDDVKLELYTITIQIYIELGSLRKAAILDAEFEPVCDKSTNNELIRKYYTVTLDLYKKLKNNYSVEYILNKLKNIEEPKEEVKTRSKFKDLSNVVIERVVETNTKEENIKELQFKNSDISNVLVSEKYKNLNKTLELITKVDSNISFRELLRESLIEFNKTYKFDEAIFYINDSKTYGYHYKLKRLYDKDFSNVSLDKSILERTKELAKEVVIEDLINNYYNQSLISGLIEEFSSVIAFPIYFNSLPIGSFGFYFKEKIEDKSNFEYYDFFSKVINILYCSTHNSELIKCSKDTLKNIENKMPIGIKTIYLDKTIFNEKGKEIFNINTFELDNNEYLELLDFNSQMAYKNAVNKILYDNIYDLELEYKLINGKTVKEHLFKSIDNIIISYFRDISIEKKKEDKLKEFAYSDNFTRVLSYKAFKSESADLLSNHDKSLVLIDSDNFSLYSNLYGYEFVNQIIYSIGSFFKNNESDKYVTYHLDNSRFIILYNNNDKRSVKKSISNLMLELSKYLNQINKRVNLKFHAGIFRQTSKDKTLDLKDILNYATEALLDAISQDIDVIVYDNNIYDDSFFIDYENELALSEAIDFNKLNSVYTPIYDLDEKNIFAYFYKFSLDNLLIDETTLNKLIYKRQLEYKIDKYKVTHVLEDLKMFYNKTGYYLNIVIPIYAKSLSNKTFITFLNNSFSFYKISSKFISFKIEGEIGEISNFELIKQSDINLGVSSIDDIFKYKLDSLYLNYHDYDYTDLSLFKSILRKKRLILTGIKSPKEVKEASIIARFVTGLAISKFVSIDNLINQALNKEKK